MIDPTGATIRFRRFVLPILTALSLFVLSASLPETRADDGEATFVGTWFLVRLTAPVAAEASMPLTTGRQALDDLILESGVTGIERVFRSSGRSPRNREAASRHGLDRTYRFHVPAGSDILVLVEAFAGLPEVELAEPDYIGEGGATFPNDPRFGGQYAYDQPSDADVDGPEAWDIEVGADVVIAVLDTGIDSDHPDLVGKLRPGFDFVNNDSDPEDDHGHGTNVSSIASANSNNAVGIVGACWHCKIMPLKVLDANSFGAYSWWADAMVWAADNGARVINLSAGGTTASATLLAGVQYAYDAGVIHVSITHNDDTFSIRYPGRYTETITVGATDEVDARADPFCYSASSGSNYGNQIDVVAPGELILGAAMNGGYNSWCGTSQASPLVAGLVGSMRTIVPSLGREEARHLLQSGAEDQVGRINEDFPGFDIYHGWGRVNMQRTLQATQASTTLHADGVTATRLFFATANALASNYDFVRGGLASLSETTAGVELGPVVCIEDDSPDPDTSGNEDTDVPNPGEGFFYVSRFGAAPGAGSYGGSSANRDRQPGLGNCATCGNDLQEGAEVCDGIDLAGETCQTLGFDAGLLSCNPGCDGFDTADCSTCGNNICEPVGGEDCLSCPDDCNGVQGGNPGDRYCCGDGDGEGPVGCSDPRCTASGNTCE